MTKTEAREKLAREIAKRKGWFRTNGQVMNDGSVTLARGASAAQHGSGGNPQNRGEFAHKEAAQALAQKRKIDTN